MRDRAESRQGKQLQRQRSTLDADRRNEREKRIREDETQVRTSGFHEKKIGHREKTEATPRKLT
jgi:hypothetical protein